MKDCLPLICNELRHFWAISPPTTIKCSPTVHDTLLFYLRSQESIFHPQYKEYDEEYVEKRYKHVDSDGRRFSDDNLIASGLKGGGYVYEWKGITKSWRCPPETMRQYEREDRLYYTRNGSARVKRYIDELPGKPPADVWLDIFPVNSQAEERVNYPTQKPESLAERIIRSSSNPGGHCPRRLCRLRHYVFRGREVGSTLDRH